jgi:glucosamine--fructose-6-phosphate aminotransferase (isomerizing)
MTIAQKPPGQMQQEIAEAPEAVRRQVEVLAGPVAELSRRLRQMEPTVVVTCARGSSAHAAAFAKHAIERHLGIPVAPAAPSIATVYHRPLKLRNQLYLCISQSGRSDDLIVQSRTAREAGALTVAMINSEESPLARECEFVLPVCAGPELSVAATKSFVATLAVILRLVGEWSENDSLRTAMMHLPERLRAASALDWSSCLDSFADAGSLITIGRGPTLSIAREAALKLKETCNLHAEGYSSAEFQHGPLALVTEHYPVLMFVPGDEAAEPLLQFAQDLVAKNAALFTVSHDPPGLLPALPAEQPEADAICMIQSFYMMAVKLAKIRGVNPDKPRHLKKVTITR